MICTETDTTMGKRARLHQAACRGKRTYRTWSEAIEQAKELNKKDENRLRNRDLGALEVYACPFGAHIHVGHARKRIADGSSQ